MRRARARPTIRGRPHASLRPGSGGRLEAPTLPSSGPPRFFSALPPRGSAHFGRALCSGTEIRKPPVKFVFQRVFWERFWAELSGLGIVGSRRAPLSNALPCRASRRGPESRGAVVADSPLPADRGRTRGPGSVLDHGRHRGGPHRPTPDWSTARGRAIGHRGTAAGGRTVDWRAGWGDRECARRGPCFPTDAWRRRPASRPPTRTIRAWSARCPPPWAVTSPSPRLSSSCGDPRSRARWFRGRSARPGPALAPSAATPRVNVLTGFFMGQDGGRSGRGPGQFPEGAS